MARRGGNGEDTVGVLSTILVAYDDSAPARRALEQAVYLARLDGGRLVVVAVQEPAQLLDGGPASEFLEQHERSQDACQLWLWAAEAYVRAHGVPARTEIRIGPLASAISDAAEAHQADLVVVGRASGPRRGIRRTRTKAELLCSRIDRPLLIVPARTTGAAP